jgi:hypothetical protein
VLLARLREREKDSAPTRISPYFSEESPDRSGCLIGVNWPDAIVVCGFVHRRLPAECRRYEAQLSCQAARHRKARQYELSAVAEECAGYEES